MYLRFVATWLVIIAVAAMDNYLTVKHSPVMDDVEINPVGMMVLKSSGGVPLLIGMKTGGVALALLFSISLWQKEWLRRKILISSYSVATLAVGLLCFMSLDVVGMQTWGIAESLGLQPVAKWSRPDAPRPVPWSEPTYEKRSPSAQYTPVMPILQPTYDSTDVAPPGHLAREGPELVATSDTNESRHGSLSARSETAPGSSESGSVSL